MSKAAKISVSIPKEDLVWAEKAARARRSSLSQVVGTALRREQQMEARKPRAAAAAKVVLGGTRGRATGMGIGLTFDTGALIALERHRQRMTDVFRAATERGLRITVPAPVVTEWWRGRKARFLQDLLSSIDVEPIGTRLAK